jgi:uncharacterized membrane protein YfcA
MDPLVVLFGLGVGVLIGMTGIGGGSLMTPLLIIVIGVKPVVAIGTDLAYGAITKTLGGWQHLRKGTVDLGVSKWLAVGSVPGCLLGVWLINRLHDVHGASMDPVLLGIVGGALMLVSFAVLGRTLLFARLDANERHTVELTGRLRAVAVGTGLVLGFVLGMTSVGSGALIGPVLILLFQLTPYRVVGTDVFHAALLLWVAGIAHWLSGNVDLGLMANILAGSLPGVWIGTHLMTRVPPTGLRIVLGCVLLGSSLGVLTKAGAGLGPEVVLGVPVLVGLLAWALQRRQARAATASALVVPPRPATERA